MRSPLPIFLMVLLAAASSVAQAGEFSVQIRPERSFGYFVGDLIDAWVEIRGPSDAALVRGSLPHSGSLTASLELRAVDVQEAGDGANKLWRIRLIYQNFYVALDAREVEIPSVALNFARPNGGVVVEIPKWRIGVAPLRELLPAQKESGADYMRPDSAIESIDETPLKNLTVALGAAALVGLLAVARDRAWPPFHRRRARIFSALARRFSSASQRPCSPEEFRTALQRLHRAIDAAQGRSVLSDDLCAFLRARPEFETLRPCFEKFFAASHQAFFQDARPGDYGMAELAHFAQALAEREKAA